MAANFIAGTLQTNQAGEVFFPRLRGITLASTPRPTFNSITQSGPDRSGTTITLDPYPLWELDIDVGHLSDRREDVDPDAIHNPGQLTPYQHFFSLFCACAGQGTAFLLDYSFITKRPEDSQVIFQRIGIGDGSTTTFQLVRKFGAYLDPVERIADASLKVFINAGSGEALQAANSYTLNDQGQVVFNTAPGAGYSISASFTWLWRMCFTQDAEEASGAWLGMYTRDKIKLRQRRAVSL